MPRVLDPSRSSNTTEYSEQVGHLARKCDRWPCTKQFWSRSPWTWRRTPGRYEGASAAGGLAMLLESRSWACGSPEHGSSRMKCFAQESCPFILAGVSPQRSISERLPPIGSATFSGVLVPGRCQFAKRGLHNSLGRELETSPQLARPSAPCRKPSRSSGFSRSAGTHDVQMFQQHVSVQPSYLVRKWMRTRPQPSFGYSFGHTRVNCNIGAVVPLNFSATFPRSGELSLEP